MPPGLAARETKGIDLAAVDLADAQRREGQQVNHVGHSDGPEPTELVEGAV